MYIWLTPSESLPSPLPSLVQGVFTRAISLNDTSLPDYRPLTAAADDASAYSVAAGHLCPRETPTTDCLLVVVLPRGIP